jgi:hypothetical protein
VGSAASLLRGTGTFRGDPPPEGRARIKSFLVPVTVKDSCDPRHDGRPAAQTLHWRRFILDQEDRAGSRSTAPYPCVQL